ncbi:response regulator transcription factor [Parasphingorhabdus halotolerans]|uniref:Response regulator transcription factor n=1 Tax=Parasphingorhabdus halotolerans TaxID=2725558 RepID=A0A6H2DQ22_9SPHN|nr:response regulator transcription factor [Parasphingorhabdus halotolerans]QJB70298.1 response regulator transcription factor [Parasphingorhabdus halotolerans]
MTVRSLLIVEDDADFARTLKRSFERRGYRVSHADSLSSVMSCVASETPDFAVVDLKLGTESGLACVKALSDHSRTIIIVVLTGYASIATAVQAVKLGAANYLPKPSNSDDIEAAFGKVIGNVDTKIETRTTQSIKTIEWEHIHEVLAETGFNISEAARRLGMHRRTLARKLEKQRIK